MSQMAMEILNNEITSLKAQLADAKKQIHTLQDTRDGWIKIFNEKDARIAELEAALYEEYYKDELMHYASGCHWTDEKKGETMNKISEATKKRVQNPFNRPLEEEMKDVAVHK